MVHARPERQATHSSTPFYTVEITQHALKGQKLLAQGNALGINDIQLTPCKGKSFTYRRGFSFFYLVYFKAFALTGRIADCLYTQGVALGYELLPFTFPFGR